MASKYGMENKWFLNSCCTRHLTNRREYLFNYRKVDGKYSIDAACENGFMNVVGIGNVNMSQVVNGLEEITMLKDVVHLSTCSVNFISLPVAQRKGLDVHLKGGETKVVATYKNDIVCWW